MRQHFTLNSTIPRANAFQLWQRSKTAYPLFVENKFKRASWWVVCERILMLINQNKPGPHPFTVSTHSTAAVYGVVHSFGSKIVKRWSSCCWCLLLASFRFFADVAEETATWTWRGTAWTCCRTRRSRWRRWLRREDPWFRRTESNSASGSFKKKKR